MNKTIALSENILQQLPFELLAHEKAVRYQQWIIRAIKPYLGNRILELGSGIGNMSRWFIEAEYVQLTEYDPQLVELLKLRIDQWPSYFPKTSVQQLDISNQTLIKFQDKQIDTIVSFNVLEHIENDRFVLQNCVDLLMKSTATGKKRIITFVPAHQWAYGLMDKSMGHYRRYNQKRIKNLHQQVAPHAKLILKPFNFVGLWGWMVNGRILKRQAAGQHVINFFEKICPLLQLIDGFIIGKLKIPLGQSLIAIQEW